ncbi:MAG: aspartyl/asparaginyl beta-hydroxylase domain-containing protein, partial [Planctomycetes bacterium]|nr:aspartyl/asparaginyl beta-hydroxylase domain-containing protein [Planctomycetota bacterium]
MTARAIFPTELFELPRRLAAGFETFRAEAAALAPDEWLPWPETAAYNHGWQTYPFVMTTMPNGFVVDFRKHRARCPGTWALLSDPRVLIAGFSRLLPGSHIYPHSDHPAFDLLRFHIGLSNAGRAGMRVPGQTMEQRAGQHYVFDSALTHEAGNLGTEPRDVLLVDFRVSPAELAEVDRLRAAFDADAATAPA